MAKEKPRYWTGDIGPGDDFGMPIHDTFIDGKMQIQGKWAIMSPESWKFHGCGMLGTGYGQRYVKQADGRWLKVEG